MTTHFITGNGRLQQLLSDPSTAERVNTIRASMAEHDQAYAHGLEAIRHAARLTQTELAERMGIKQPTLSALEARDDLLLSTLKKYLVAAGATDVTITATLDGQPVEITVP